MTPPADLAAATGATGASAAAVDSAAGATRRDFIGRMVAPVRVNGQGPYRFIVDTGANRSVLSQGVAESLGLNEIGQGTIYTVHGVAVADLVAVDSLTYGPLSFPSAAMPVLSGNVLAGQQGVLGVDGMQGRRLRLDLRQRCIEIVPSRGAPTLGRGWTRLRGELRFGHLVVVRGTVNSIRVNVLIDTGSNSSFANRAFHAALNARVRRVSHGEDVVRAYTAGEPIILDSAVMVPRLEMNELQVQDMLVYIGDFDVFHLWGLADQPTILIGMDIISQAHGIAIDYTTASVYFQIPGQMRTGSRLRR